MNNSGTIAILEKHDLSSDEIKTLHKDPDEIARQLGLFEGGVKPAELVKPATLNDGIKKINENEYSKLYELQEKAAAGGRFTGFVPASGAASRMFAHLEGVLAKYGQVTKETLEKNREEDKSARLTLEFFDNFERFAFYGELMHLMYETGIDPGKMLKDGDYTRIIKYIVGEEGLNYSAKPKGCIPFHQYGKKARTAFEEHLYENVNYIMNKGGRGKLHFTVPVEFANDIAKLFDVARARLIKNNMDFDISFSAQQKTTDTIALDMENKPVRQEDGSLLFRPGGHGALLQNLNELNADLVYIKNVDNVVHERLMDEIVKYKKLLGGLLVKLQEELHEYLRELDKNPDNKEIREKLEKFAEKELFAALPEKYSSLNEHEKVKYLCYRFNRPLRVAGMVENLGHAGGGPFFIKNENGEVTPQIVESSQIDLGDPAQKKIFESSTHFNPVDIVCSLRNYKGEQFDLRKFVDQSTAFITVKTKNGQKLKALEHPGLWNGSMADWITVFAEIPSITFNPVKTVNDLIKEEHQPQ